jgi:hypothetical protein
MLGRSNGGLIGGHEAEDGKRIFQRVRLVPRPAGIQA